MQIPTEIGNPWLLWNVIGAGDKALLPSGEVKDEGLYRIPDSPMYLDGPPVPWTVQEFVDGVVPQDELDKIEGIVPLRNHDLEDLVGQTCVAVVYDSDISINYDPINGNLQGGRHGLFAFTVGEVKSPGSIPESTSDTSLLDLWIEVESVQE